MLFDILALISLLIIITLLKRLVNVFPSLMACMIRLKENFNIQLSLKMRTDRNLISAAMYIPFCLLASRFRLYSPSFMDGFTDNGRLGVMFGVISIYMLLRVACRYIFRLHSTSETTYKTASDSARTYFAVLTLLLLVIGSILTFAGVHANTIKTAMIWISGGIYTLFIIRKTQIFHSSCSFFVSFLYLCALEILPTGVLIASAVIF